MTTGLHASQTPDEADVTRIPLREGLSAWFRVAGLSFGGPAGQIAVMHRIVVEEKKWVPEDRFLHAMSYCMLLPGPEAQQLATYLGWMIHGRLGGVIAGTLFILPGFAALLALSVLYASLGETGLVASVFYGLKPAVMAVVVAALVRIGRRSLTTTGKRAISVLSFVAMFALDVPFPIVILGAGLLGYLNARGVPAPSGEMRTSPPIAEAVRTTAFWGLLWLSPFLLLQLPIFDGSIFLAQAGFFSKAATVTFGGAYAVLAYVAQQAVEVQGWLLPGEMLDGLGMAETTPGPLIQVVQFVGYMGAYRNPGAFSPLTAGVIGSIVVAWVTFVPCFLFVLVGAPWAEYLRGRPALQSALEWITAAVTGAILNLSVWFSIHTLFGVVRQVETGPLDLLAPEWASIDPAAALLATAAMIAMLRYRVAMHWVLLAAGIMGILLT